jgi:Ca2+-binding EF-hand superfamily protein
MLTEDQRQYLRKQFDALDLDRSETIRPAELLAALQSKGLDADREELSGIMSRLGVDTDGHHVTFEAFQTAMLAESSHYTSDLILEAFRTLDADGDGKVSTGELLAVMREHVDEAKGLLWSMADANELMAEFDVDGDGFVDYEEFSASLSRLALNEVGWSREWRASLRQSHIPQATVQ